MIRKLDFQLQLRPREVKPITLEVKLIRNVMNRSFCRIPPKSSPLSLGLPRWKVHCANFAHSTFLQNCTARYVPAFTQRESSLEGPNIEVPFSGAM